MLLCQRAGLLADPPILWGGYEERAKIGLVVGRNDRDEGNEPGP